MLGMDCAFSTFWHIKDLHSSEVSLNIKSERNRFKFLRTCRFIILMENRFSRRQLEISMMAYWLELLLRWKSIEVVSAKFTYRVEQVWNFTSTKN